MSTDGSWDNIIHFGKGKQKGAGHTGFFPQGSQSVFTGILWRGDSRKPEVVFKDGFALHKDGVEVSGRTTSSVTGINTDKGTTRGGVSLSKSMVPGGVWAGAAGDEKSHGWLYAVYIQNEPWAAEIRWNAKDYQSKAALFEAGWQQEIMLLNVPGSSIVAARKVKSNKPNPAVLTGAIVYNKYYHGPNVLTTCGTDFSVNRFKSADNTPVIPQGADQQVYLTYLDTL